jgi:hypothetical protein
MKQMHLKLIKKIKGDKMGKETSLYQDANTLCNKLDNAIIDLTNECVDSPCVIYSKEEKKIDIFTKMHEAFGFDTKALKN